MSTKWIKISPGIVSDIIKVCGPGGAPINRKSQFYRDPLILCVKQTLFTNNAGKCRVEWQNTEGKIFVTKSKNITPDILNPLIQYVSRIYTFFNTRLLYCTWEFYISFISVNGRKKIKINHLYQASYVDFTWCTLPDG